MSIVSNEDIHREARVAATDRQFEQAQPAGGAGEAKEQLLDLEMACIRRLCPWVASEIEACSQAKSRSEAEPRRDRCGVALPQLEPADHALAYPNEFAERRLCQ